MKYLILLSIIFTLSFVAYDQNAFAILGCDVPHCYSLVQSDRFSSVEGIEYELDSPDLWVDRNACLNIAVSTGWLVALPLSPTVGPEWVESGVTKGDVKNVGCVTVLSTYYAFNNIVGSNPVYQEYLIPNGRVDPGDDIEVILQRNSLDASQIQVFVTTPYINSAFPIAQLSMNPNNIYDADFGIEGTISALDEYSSIPMSKFTNLKINQNNSWINLPSTAPLYTPNAAAGYIGIRCPDTSFVTGTVMSPIDCSVVAVRNQIPLVDNQIINISTNAPFTINLDDIDTDQDYLQYILLSNPTSGTLDFFNVNSRIPNTDGDSAELVYTPANSTPDSDSFLYSVTDKRDGHTREGLITIIGPVPAPTISDPVDDFSYTLNGITINFDWSEPSDGGSAIKNYKVERSVDTVTWGLHDWFTETSFSYERYEGYDQYFRVFANNENGLSASSNVINIHIPDSTPPSITIYNPNNGETLLLPDVFIDGLIVESESSGIEDVKIWLDNIVRPEFITIDILSIDSYVLFESLLNSVSNGNYLLMVTAENGDGVLGSDSITITVDAPVPTQVGSFEDNFEVDMSNWNLATEDDEYWSVRTSPIVPVPNSLPGNKVAGTEDCDNVCTMTMIDYVDLTQMISPTLSFYRYVSTSADIPGEGIILNVSLDNGNTWIVLDSFIADESDDDGLWHLQEYDLSSYSASTQFKLKFEAISTSNSEDTELDDITIYDANAVLPPTPDFKIQRGNIIMNSTDTTSSIIEGVDFEQCTGDCYIQITGSKNTGMGKTFNGGIGNFDNWTSFISDDSGLHTSGGAIDFSRHVTDNRDNRITWQITEHIGELTGPNEMKVLDTGVCNFGNSTLTCSVNIQNGATDGNDVVVLITGVASPDDGLADLQTMLVTTQWDDLSDTAIFTRGESNNDATKISYAVIEYSGTNWSVQRITHNGTSEDLSTETLTNDVGDISRAFIAQVQQRNSAGDTYNRICQSGEEVWISNTNELSFNHPWFSANWDSNITEVVWVVSNSETDSDKAMIVQHLQPTDQRDTLGSEEENWQVTINPLTYSTDETALTGISTHTDGCGTAYPNSSILGILFESGLDQVDFYQSDAGQEQDYAFSVVQYPRSIPSP